MRRVIIVISALMLILAGCGADDADSGDDGDEMTGFIVIDAAGSHLCSVLLESYPPQCGDVIVDLGDLIPEAVVALQSPDDPTLAAVQWTDYVLGVTGSVEGDVMTGVTLTDPVAEASSGGIVVRVADLGITRSQPVTFPIDIRNATDTPLPLTFTSGQRAEITLSRDGVEVYRWSEGYAFSQAIEERTLEAGQLFGTTVTDDPIDLPAGEYDAKAWITAGEAIDVVVEWRTTIEG